MLRFIVLTVLLGLVWADSEETNRKCMRITHPETMHCCKKEMPRPSGDPEELKECFQIPPKPHSCEHDICIGKKRGYASDDGTVNMKAYQAVIEKDFASDPTLVQLIKDVCINSAIDVYGPPDACKLEKLKHCTHAAAAMNCKEWDDKGHCAGIKALVEECKKNID